MKVGHFHIIWIFCADDAFDKFHREVDGIHGCSIQPWEVWCLALEGQEGEKEPMA